MMVEPRRKILKYAFPVKVLLDPSTEFMAWHSREVMTVLSTQIVDDDLCIWTDEVTSSEMIQRQLHVTITSCPPVPRGHYLETVVLDDPKRTVLHVYLVDP